MRTHPTSPNVRRSGFTLIEILVVMVIIAILVGLGIGLLGSSGQQARIAATQATLKHLDAALRQRTEAFRTANFAKEVDKFVNAFDAANGMPLGLQGRKSAEILVRKNAFKSMLPQREEDLWGLDGVEDNPSTWSSGGGDDSPLRKVMYDNMGTLKTDSWKAKNEAMAAMMVAAATRSKAESSELLYLALTQGLAYGLSPVSLDGLLSSAIGDTDEDGNTEILDAWGEPIQYYAWPTQLMTDTASARILIPGLPSQLTKDPDDPLKMLSSNSKLTSDYQATITGTSNPKKGFTAAFYHDPEVYHIPIIISAGPDRVLGIASPDSTGQQRLCQVLSASDVLDNITNRQGK